MYVRHRDRMIQESIFEDLRDTLIACRWVVGTTSHPVLDPNDPGAGPQVLTTDAGDILPLARGKAITLIDYFPESEGESFSVESNTFAMDNGNPGEAQFIELGSNSMEQGYVFSMAFYAISDAVAMALLGDLRDRYAGRIVRGDSVMLYDYNTEGPDPVVRMEVNSFRYTQNTDAVAPAEVHLYFAELQIVDFIDGHIPQDPLP